MTAKYYACFVLQQVSSNGCRELGSVVEIDERFGAMLSFDDVAEMLADNLDLSPDNLTVFHWSRVH